MADIKGSLPVRTQNAGDLDIFISDATTPTQKLKVNADGSVDTNFAAGSQIEITDGTDTLQVNADGSINTNFAAGSAVEITDGTDTLAIEADGSINVNASFSPGTLVRLTDGVENSEINASGELQVRDDDANTLLGTIDADTSNLDVALSTRASEATLSTVAGDTTSIDGKLVDGNDIGDVTINNAAGAAAVNIQDGGNSITVDGAVDASGSTLGANDGVDIGDVTVNNGSGASAVNIQDGGNSITVDATALDIRALSDSTDSVAIGDGTETLAINTDGSINVKMSDRSGTEIDDFDLGSAIASDATDNHDYVTTGAFRLTQVHVSASSAMKAEVQIETGAATGVFDTLAVMFTTESDLNYSFVLKSPKLVVSGARVRVIRTNLDNQAQDLYSTILGFNE